MEQRRNAVYLIIILSLLAGLVTGRSFFFNVAYAFIGLLILAFLWTWSSITWLRLRRQTRARRAQVGQYMEERFTVINSAILPKLWLEIYDQSDLPGHRASTVISGLAPRSEKTWQVQTLCVKRGSFRLGPLVIVAGDPFGLFQIERSIPATSSLIVYPPTIEIADFFLPVGALPGGDALRRRTQQVTTNAAGVRNYAPGDSFSRIHWPSTARKNRLIVKEFELDPLADIWVIMDAERTVHTGNYQPTDEDIRHMQETGHGLPFRVPPTTEEYAVAITASMVRFFLQRDRAVGFLADGGRRESVPADRGPRQLTKILETLALIRVRGTLTFQQMLTMQANQLPRGTTVLLVTPSTRGGWITAAHTYQQRGLRVVVILVDAESFGGRPGATRVAQQLGMLGIPVYIVRRGDNLQLVLSRPHIAG